ncbi:hypothetical protein JTB14_004327 [Gonioctena quinquepunctata]|nr:hypothetical protein JTB14_004327 [Gonioctena quinquepunctata]
MTNVGGVRECMSFTQRKNGFAFNFIPREALHYIEGPIANCQVLSCTEIANSITLIPDLLFDYYSVYGNWNITSNATCLRNTGLFVISHEKLNYTNSIIHCQSIGADLADTSTEKRTKLLSQIIDNSLQSWYKVAYVGLDDTDQEGTFVSVNDVPLTCSNYRAWAPGHPRSSKNNEDCVVLDSERMWRVVDCGSKLPALCEFFPGRPNEVNDLVNVSCTKNNSKMRKKKCEVQQSIHELFKDAERKEKCAILNYEDIPHEVTSGNLKEY